MTEMLLSLVNVTKRYGTVLAVNDVSIAVGKGEIVGLVGENGAGKSTLMKILGGVVAPTAGRIIIDGQEARFDNARQSMAAGIAFVHQELNSFANLNVAANILMGREPRRGPFGVFVDSKRSESLVRPLLERLRADFEPSTPVSDLSIAERQLLEIARALSLEAKLVIMDEPTSSLTLAESSRLLQIVKELRESGVSIIFITHRLNEIVELADRVVVLRDGRVAGRLAQSEITPPAMIKLMIGRTLQNLYAPPAFENGGIGLEIKGARTASYPAEEINLAVRKGEILGLAGLVGAGRSELARALFGIDPLVAGEVRVGGKAVVVGTARRAMASGLALVPEDRKQSGLLLDESIAENIALASWPSFSRNGVVDTNVLDSHAKRQIAEFDIHTPGPATAARELSGGNQQKVVLAKWMPRKPDVLICDEPTRGVDVGARHEIYARLRRASDEGAAVLLISSDMEEVLGVSDRIAVMHEGRINGFLERHDFSEHNVLRLAMTRAVREGEAA
jgi:ribose transport system ATP-binding protein